MSNSMHSTDLQEHYTWAKRLAYGLVRDTEVAGDLAQETWLAVLKNPPVSGVHPRAWWAGILRKKALHYWRSKRRREDHEQRAAEHVGSSNDSRLTPEELLASSETTRSLLEELEQLPEPFRGTLLAAAHSGMSSAEIARQEKLPQGTVRWRMKRGRELLAERLDQRFGDRDSWMHALIPLLAGGPSWFAGVGAGVLVAASLLLSIAVGVGYQMQNQSEDGLGIGRPALEPAGELVLAQGSASDGLASMETIPQERALVIDQPPAAADQVASSTNLRPGQSGVQARVVDPQGEPMPGVLFEIPGARGSFSRTNRNGLASLRFWPASNSARVGLFVGNAGKQAAGAVARQFLSVNVRVGEWSEQVSVVVHPLVAFEGKIVDENGDGVAGVSLFVTGDQGTPMDPQSLLEGPELWKAYSSHTALSKANGAFSLLAPACSLQLWAGKRGHLYTVLTNPEPGTQSELQLSALPDGQWIRGRVTTPNGQPIAKVEVRSGGLVPARRRSSELKLPGSLAWRWDAMEAVTNERGEFLVPVHGYGRQQVRLWDADDQWEELDLELLPGPDWQELRFLSELR